MTPGTEGGTAPTLRRAWVGPCVGSFAVAVVAGAYLALHNAPRADEFHTLAYVRLDDLGDVWTSYRQVRDTLPPVAYVLSWLWAQVAGTGLVATRVPVVLAWGVAAAALSLLARRAGPWPAFAAGVVPTASALLFLGAFARPYAPAFAAFAVALVCWERAGDPAAAGRRWLIGCGSLFAVASLLHYAMAAAALVVAAVALVAGADRARARGRVVAPLVGGLVPVLASAALLPSAIEDQGRLPRSVSPLDAVRFWPSTLRPGWPAIVLIVAVAIGVLVAARAGRGDPGERSAGTVVAPAGVLRHDLVWLGWGLVVAVPVLVVVAMTLTSGTYVHRYGVAALAGAGLLVAQLSAHSGRWHRAAPVVIAVGLVLGTITASVDTADQMVSVDEARALPEQLGLTTGDRAVVVADEYDFLLLQTYAPADLRRRMALGSDPAVSGTGPLVDVDARVARPAPDGAAGFDLVGTLADVERLVPPGAAWEAVVDDEATYVRPDVPRELVRARVEPRDRG